MTKKSKILLGELFADLGLLGEYHSFASIPVDGIGESAATASGRLLFVAQERLLPALASARPAAFVVSESLWPQAEPWAQQAGAPVLHSSDAMLALAKASRHFSTETPAEPGVHPTAVVHPSVRLGKGVSVGPFVTVEREAEIRDGAVLQARVHVGARSVVGEGSVLFPGVVVYQDVQLGSRVRVHANSVIGADGFGYVQEKTAAGLRHVKIHHLGGVKVGDDVEIGAGTTVDRGTLGCTQVGNGCILDNQVQVGHNCVLEEGVIVCGCSGLAGSAQVGKFALLAGFVGVGNRVRIGAGAQVAGFSSVTSHIPAGEKWGGIPVMPQGQNARLHVLLRRLPEVIKKLTKEKAEKEKEA